MMNPPPTPAPFTSAHRRARIVQILLIVGAFVTALSLLVGVLSVAFPPLTNDQEPGDNPAGFALNLLTLLVAIPEILIYLATVVFFLMWLYRAHGNLRAFNPWSRLQYSSTLAVGSFFIPFANLVVPYRAVKEVWQNSGPPDEGQLAEPSPPASFPVWWLFWILANFANNLSFRMSLGEKDLPESTAAIVSVVAGTMSILAAIFAYLVVDAIDKRQEETSGKLGLGKFSGPPPPPPDLSTSNAVVPY